MTLQKMAILTGFGRYGKYEYNLSSEIVKNFKNKIDNYLIKKVILPVTWRKSIHLYKNLLLQVKNKPNLVILLGVYSNNSLSIEKIAWNFAIGNDIENNVKFGLIRLSSKLYIKSGVNLKKLYSLIRDKINIRISYYPGLYLCNYLYYWALDLSNRRYPVIFIHIPHNGKLNEYIEKIETLIHLIIKLCN